MMSAVPDRIAFLGLGIMGSRMAANLAGRLSS
jgi:3-hydroxyisobutyrate dehydrogenase-like beta-hydroxyacid dehydrogenase